MARRDEIQARLEAVKEFFYDKQGEKFTLREVMDALVERGDAHLFAAEAQANKRKERARNKPQAEEGASEEMGLGGAAAAERKRRKRRVKTDEELMALAQLQQLKRSLEELEGKTSSKSKLGGDQMRPCYLVKTSRKIGSLAEPVWKASKQLVAEREDLDVEKFSGWTALKAVSGVLDWTMPLKVQEDVKEYRREAEEKFKDLRTTSPTVRWLDALLLRPSTYHFFMSQQIDDHVRSVVEDAIMLKRKVRLLLDPADENEPFGGEAVKVSISRYILTLPNIPEILVYPHYEGVDRYGDRSEIVECLRIPLSKIKEATLLDEEAEFRPIYLYREKGELESVLTQYGRAREWTEGSDVAELRVEPGLMSRWSGTWIHKNMEVIGTDLEGWVVCRLRYPKVREKYHGWSDFGDDLFDFLAQYAFSVEILSPENQRRRFWRDSLRRAAMYNDAQVDFVPGDDD
ncbi:hypothetical protein [Pseudoxanthomonas mexicana]|uniref:hypothetical protein n=1 Tax=Pseudoxanthomonas mexicana TaxID=128785 RepID=UPI00398B5A45